MNTRAWLFAAISAALLSVLFVLLRPDAPEAPPASAPASAPAATPGASAAPAPAKEPAGPSVFEFAVREGTPSGPPVIRVRQGDAVMLRVTSDRADALHLHGYDLGLPLQPGRPAELTFVADRSGRFELELHESHMELGAVEVLPR